MKKYVIENAPHQTGSIKFNSKSAGMHNLVFSLFAEKIVFAQEKFFFSYSFRSLFNSLVQ